MITTVEILDLDNQLEPNIYTREAIEQMVANAQDTIAEEKLFGHLEGSSHMLADISHVVKKLYLDGNKLMAEIVLLETTPGIYLKQMIETEPHIGVGYTLNTNNDNIECIDGYIMVGTD